jgi:hypothetical protein
MSNRLIRIGLFESAYLNRLIQIGLFESAYSNPLIRIDLFESTWNWVWMEFESNLNQLQIDFKSTSNQLQIDFKSTSNRLQIDFKSTSNRLRIDFKLNSNWLQVNFESTLNWLWINIKSILNRYWIDIVEWNVESKTIWSGPSGCTVHCIGGGHVKSGPKFPQASKHNFSSFDALKKLNLVSKDSLFNSLSIETKLILFGVVRGPQDAVARRNPAKNWKSAKFPAVQF